MAGGIDPDLIYILVGKIVRTIRHRHGILRGGGGRLAVLAVQCDISRNRTIAAVAVVAAFAAAATAVTVVAAAAAAATVVAALLTRKARLRRQRVVCVLHMRTQHTRELRARTYNN